MRHLFHEVACREVDRQLAPGCLSGPPAGLFRSVVSVVQSHAVVMDEAWNSSRLAGGWSDLRTCVDVASARGSGVEIA